MKNTILLILSFLILSISYAGNPVKKEKETNLSSQLILKGKVTDKKTGEALVGASILLSDLNIKTYTDLEGNFEIKNLKEGQYNIIVSFISYTDSLIENAKLISNIDKPMEIELIENNK